MVITIGHFWWNTVVTLWPTGVNHENRIQIHWIGLFLLTAEIVKVTTPGLSNASKASDIN